MDKLDIVRLRDRFLFHLMQFTRLELTSDEELHSLVEVISEKAVASPEPLGRGDQVVSCDVPFLLRLLEFVREELEDNSAETEIQELIDRMCEIEVPVFTMNDYPRIHRGQNG